VGLFSRRRDDDTPTPGADVAQQDEAATADRSEPGPLGRGRSHGPWDVTEVPDLGARLDLGAVRIPGLVGMQLRMEMDQGGSRVVAVNLGFDGSALQVQAFAAPRTFGIWDELRAELAGSVTRQGGTVDEVQGPFGQELLARLPIRTPEGRSGHRPARFIGVDGPRWFLRGVLTGRAAVDPEAAAPIEAVLREVVVVRGDEARAPRDLLPLHLPGRGQPAGPGAAPPIAVPTDDLLRRGPEITEIR
jgi:hypothetical protein